MYVPYITHAFSNISSISQLDISVTRNERVDRRGRKRAVDVMLYDSSSNIELDQGNTTTEKTNDPVERHNDTAIDNVQGIVKGVENSCNKCQETQKEMVTLLKELQTEVQQWKEKYNDLKESSKQMADQRSTLSLDNHRESNNTAAPINTEKRSRPLMERSNSSQMEHKPQPVPQQ
ncbi:hypothetical protein Pmani_010072 [Petrolisthes manimaculis]|uniref:Uncharacterized protein n=1 Tax=Petrolisthes manimaculis TaxID=1843537 RepID=A0AAE1Q3U9_9EUCA|nr:hypothetical protein Pmani_010072 [Petrolisthes manimaculis]